MERVIRALDTNILVRVLAEPDSAQYALARAAMQTPFTVPVSVMLETEWVLRSVFRWRRDQIADAMLTLLELPECHAGSSLLRWVIARFADGADFADMVHLVLADAADRFVTFDKDLVRKAGLDAPIKIETLS